MMKKILMVNDSGEWGGAEKIFYTIATMLSKNGFYVLCALGGKGTLFEKLNNLGIHTICYKEKNVLNSENSFVLFGKRFPNFIALIQNYSKLGRVSKSLRQIIIDFAPDFIYLNNLRPLVIFNRIPKDSLSFKNKPKVFWHEHGYQRSFLRQIYLDVFLLKNVDKVITVSKHTASGHIWKAKQKIHVVHNGISQDKTPTKQEKSFHGNKSFIFIVPAFITYWKGQMTVLKAVDYIKRRNDSCDFQVWFVGNPRTTSDKKYFKKMKRFAETKSLDQIVQFKGFRTDVLDLMNSADVVISSSVEHDPFPTILLEACMLGKAAICTDAGGSSEIVANGLSGFVVPRRDYRSLAEAMLKLRKDTETRKKFEIAAKKRYETYFTIDKFRDRLLKVMEE